MHYSKKSSISGASAGIWIPPSLAIGFVGTWALTREAAGNCDVTLTAAANSPFLVLPLHRGCRLTSIDFVYSIATANLTSLTAAVKQAKYVNGAVATISDLFAAAAIPGVQTTNIAVNNLVVGSAPVPGAELVGLDVGAHENDPNSTTDYLPDTWEYIELALVNPGTSVFKFYGAMLYGDKLF